MADTLAALESTVRQLQHQVGVLEDTHAIRRLQHAYGYYIDKCLYDETVDLFSDSGQVFMPMEETFFAVRFAMLRDKFGTSWMILALKPQTP